MVVERVWWRWAADGLVVVQRVLDEKRCGDDLMGKRRRVFESGTSVFGNVRR